MGATVDSTAKLLSAFSESLRAQAASRTSAAFVGRARQAIKEGQHELKVAKATEESVIEKIRLEKEKAAFEVRMAKAIFSLKERQEARRQQEANTASSASQNARLNAQLRAAAQEAEMTLSALEESPRSIIGVQVAVWDDIAARYRATGNEELARVYDAYAMQAAQLAQEAGELSGKADRFRRAARYPYSFGNVTDEQKKAFRAYAIQRGWVPPTFGPVGFPEKSTKESAAPSLKSNEATGSQVESFLQRLE